MEELGLFAPKVPLMHFPSAKIKMDELFNEWLTVEGGTTLCTILIESITLNGTSTIKNDQASDSASPMQQRGNNTAYKSPKKRTQSEMIQSNIDELHEALLNSDNESLPLHESNEEVNVVIKNHEGSSMYTSDNNNNNNNNNNNDGDDTHNVKGRRANFDKIPVFFIPGRRNNNHLRNVNNDDDLLVKRLPEIEAFFKPFPGGIPIEKFVHVTKRLCGVPSFFNMPLCRRINERFGDSDAGIPPPRTIGRSGRTPSGVKIKMKAFLRFWQSEIEPYDKIERFVRIIKKPESDFIYKDDFIPFLQELLHFHPGLDFLETHEEFQRKYALTVITRIFYAVNTSRSGKLSLREVRHSNLFTACMHVDEETDINKVVEYFSYEHFYVLYCKFFELDGDKDSKLTRNDLLKYGDHSLSNTIVDRIFQVGVRVFTDGHIGGFDAHGGR
jgi:hypothetical protein